MEPVQSVTAKKQQTLAICCEIGWKEKNEKKEKEKKKGKAANNLKLR